VLVTSKDLLKELPRLCLNECQTGLPKVFLILKESQTVSLILKGLQTAFLTGCSSQWQMESLTVSLI